MLKGVIELNWKILIAIIAGVIAFIIIFLLIMTIINSGSVSAGAREFCLLLLSKLKIFGIGAEQLKICDVFISG